MISVFYIDENRSVERADSCGDFKWAVLEPRWTGGLDNPPALIVSKMVSDEDAPMEIWRFNIHGLSNNNQGRGGVCPDKVWGATKGRCTKDDDTFLWMYLKTDNHGDSVVGFSCVHVLLKNEMVQMVQNRKRKRRWWHQWYNFSTLQSAENLVIKLQ